MTNISGKTISAAERRIKALELRKQGMTLRAIGDVLGVSATTISNDLKVAIDNLNAQEQAEDEAGDALAERRQQALELRKQGYSYRAIGRVLEVSHQTAANDVKAALAELDKIERLEASEMRRLMAERIDMARHAIAVEVISGNMGAVDRWIKLNEQEAKLFGLNEPEKIGFTFEPEMLAAMQILNIEPSRAFEQFKQIIMTKAKAVNSPVVS